MTSPASRPPSPIDEATIATSLGRAVAGARAERKLSARALASSAGISQPFLSQIENGQTMPSLVTLYRIATALGLAPADLLPVDDPNSSVHLVRRSEGPRVPVSEAPNTAVGRILSVAESRVVTTEYRVTPDEDMGDWFQSNGDLLVYVSDGRIAVTVDGRGTWELEAGDAISYSGHMRNVWTVLQPATILLVHTSDA